MQRRAHLVYSPDGEKASNPLKIGEVGRGHYVPPPSANIHPETIHQPTTKPFQTLRRRTSGEQGVQNSAPPPSIDKAFGPPLPKGEGEQALSGLRSLRLSPSDPQNAARAARGSPREPAGAETQT